MKTFEFEGKSTEEAVNRACQELNVTTDDMEIEIIEPGSAGIFGLVGNRKAKIRISILQGDLQENETLSDNGDGLPLAKEALEKILSLIPMENTTVMGERVDGTIALTIDGDKSGLLIGRKGRTLDALQFIVNKIVNKALEKRVQVVVDSENYRKRRQDFLIQMALKMSEKAKKSQKSVSTNLLNSHERRIVHLALKDDQNLETRSRGEGLLKKVVIIPKS